MNEFEKISSEEEKVIAPVSACDAATGAKAEETSASEVCRENESPAEAISEATDRISENEQASCVETESPAEAISEATDRMGAAAGEGVCAEEESPAEAISEATDRIEASESDKGKEKGTDFKLFHAMSRTELLAALKEIVEAGRLDAYREVNAIRKAYNERKEEEAAKELEDFIEAGNSPMEFSSTPADTDEEFYALANSFRERRTEFVAAEENRRKENLAKKKEIVEKILALTEDIDNINLHYPEFKQLQADFKEIKEIPESEVNDIWKNFQAAIEQFYDRLKLNKELRDLDFKKNLEIKRALVEKVKKLETHEDVVEALRRLQELREQWRETGPVAKELRDEIWKEFNNSASVVFRRHQDFFDARKASEQEAENEKTALCEKAEEIAARECSRSNEWEAGATELKELQEKWKTVGFASRKMNNALFARFRKACDDFFAKRNDHYRTMRDRYEEAIKCKEALIAKTVALAEEENTQKAIAEVLKIQEDWKHAGVVPVKHKDALWKRFREACDVIFDRRKKETSEQRQEQNANLQAKRAVIARLKEIPKDLDRKEGIALVRDLQKEWQNIGFVPFKHKNEIQDEYRAIVDELYDNFKMKEQRARMKNFSEQIDSIGGDDSKLGRERERLMRDLDRKQQELKTYRNNLGFFNVKSSAGNSMLKEMERRTKQIEEEIATIRKKIEMVDNKIDAE